MGYKKSMLILLQHADILHVVVALLAPLPAENALTIKHTHPLISLALSSTDSPQNVYLFIVSIPSAVSFEASRSHSTRTQLSLSQVLPSQWRLTAWVSLFLTAHPKKSVEYVWAIRVLVFVFLTAHPCGSRQREVCTIGSRWSNIWTCESWIWNKSRRSTKDKEIFMGLENWTHHERENE